MSSFDDESSARATLEAWPGLTWRPFERDDLPAVARFFAEVEAHDDNPEHQSLEGLQDFWDAERSVPHEDTLAAYDEDGAVVAVAWSGCNREVTVERRARLNGAVLPARRGAGLGRLIMAWQMAHALAWDAASRRPDHGPLVLRLFAPVDQRDVRHLAERAGLTVDRYFYEMECPLEGDGARAEQSSADPPGGVRLTDWDSARQAELRAVLDASFAEHWGHVDATDQMWREALTAHSFRPAWSVVAVDEADDRVVGVAMNAAYEQDWSQERRVGFTDQVGVLSSHRGRGIASALLRESMRRFSAAGLTTAGLDVDVENGSGALRLYESLGYVRVAATCA